MAKKRQNKPLPPVPDTVRIYTDGSCFAKTRQGGWGVYVVSINGEDEFYQGLSEDTTISRMEMLAMQRALQVGLKLGSEFNIYSDSAMVVNSINLGWLKNWYSDNFVGRDNSDIWKPIWNSIQELKRRRIKFYVHHINGHLKDTDHPHVLGNHIADMLCDYRQHFS